MIGITHKIHDKYSIEFKVRFTSSEDEGKVVPVSDFAINTWFFIPYALDINHQTYDKTRFNRDVKSNIRLITPRFSIHTLAEYKAAPYANLRDAVASLGTMATKEDFANYEFQLKLFAAIFKSAVRDAVNELIASSSAVESSVRQYVKDCHSVLDHFHELRRSVPLDQLATFDFADEFMGNILEIHTVRLVEQLDVWLEQGVLLDRKLMELCASLSVLMRRKVTDRKVSSVDFSDSVLADINNQQLLSRHALLKKFVEGALYLKVVTHKDGRKVEQFWFGVAAGLAMIISTLIALPFQKYWAGYPALLFTILVVAYGFKDRSKEWLRGLFSNQLKNRYFDNKTIVKVRDTDAGWIKESVDFVTDSMVPAEVMRLRGRNALEKANPMLDEQILFYRKRVRVDADILNNQYSYTFEGINDIMRFHWNHIVQKMTGPDVALNSLDEHGNIRSVIAQRVYAIHIVMQLECKDQLDYRCFKVSSTRDGIVSVEEIVMGDTPLVSSNVEAQK